MSVAAETPAAAEVAAEPEASVLAAAVEKPADEKPAVDAAAAKATDAKVEKPVVDAKAAEAAKVAGEAKANADKAAAEKAEAEKLDKAAAALALKLPEGVDAKDPTVAEFKKLAAKAGLDSAKAQGLYDLHAKALSAAQKAGTDASVAEIATTRKEWVSQLKADKEYGGAKFPETQALLKKVMTRYAPDAETLEFLNSGPGDHPGLVKLIARIGRDLAEDTVAKSTTAGKPNGAASAEERLRKAYPNSPELFANH